MEKHLNHYRINMVFLCVLGLFITNNINGQVSVIKKITVLPNPRTSSDSILVTDSVITPTPSAFIVYKNATINGNKIEIKYCMRDTGGWDIVGFIKDTINLGTLPDGIYECGISVKYQSPGEPPCEFLSNWDSVNITFSVGHTSAIIDLTTEQLSFSPNPVNTTLYLQTSSTHFSTQIVDATGRVCGISSNTKQLDVSTLLSGIYLLRLQNEQGNVVRRFVKQ